VHIPLQNEAAAEGLQAKRVSAHGKAELAELRRGLGLEKAA
jgi:hypothetical protein